MNEEKSDEKLELCEEDARFVHDLNDLEPQYLDRSNPYLDRPVKPSFYYIKSRKGYREWNGRIRKLDLSSWFVDLLPWPIKAIINAKTFLYLKEELTSLFEKLDREDFKRDLITIDEVDIDCDSDKNLPHWYLNIIPESLGHLPELKRLDLSYNFLTNLPESMKNLENLRELDLRYNLFKDLPDWLGELPKLTNIELYNNPLRSVPACVIKIAKEHYAPVHIQQGVVPSEAEVLGILEILTGSVLAIIEYDDQDLDHYSYGYKINDDGHITKLFLGGGEDFRLGIFPELICNLEHLEKLWMPDNALKSLPESLSKLKNLKELNLSRYRPDTRFPFHIPESLIPFLKEIKKLNLSYDIMEKLSE